MTAGSISAPISVRAANTESGNDRLVRHIATRATERPPRPVVATGFAVPVRGGGDRGTAGPVRPAAHGQRRVVSGGDDEAVGAEVSPRRPALPGAARDSRG